MSKSNVFEFQDRDAHGDPLTEMLRTGAQQLIRKRSINYTFPTGRWPG